MRLGSTSSPLTSGGSSLTGRQWCKRPHQPAPVLSLTTISRRGYLGGATPASVGRPHGVLLAQSPSAALLGSHRLRKLVQDAAGKRQRQKVASRVAAPDAVNTEDEGEDEGEELSYIEQLNDEYGIEGIIQFSTDEYGLPRVWIRHPWSMMGVELYLHGATITRWLRPDGVAALDVHEEQLQASMEAWARTPSSGIGPALRGAGLKLQFPVARENSIMPYEDGFASRLPWEVVSAGYDFCPINDGLWGEEYEKGMDNFIQMEQELEAQGKDITKARDTPDPLGPSLLDLSGLIRTPPEKAEGEEAEPAAEPSAPPPPEAAAPDLEEEEEDDQEETAAERAAQAAASGQDAPSTSAPAAGKKGRPRRTRPPAPAAAAGAANYSVDEDDDDDGEDELFAEWDMPDQLGDAEYDILAKFESGLDPAPFVTLRLTDNEHTRKIWPHAFELVYKVTVMEEDDYEDFTAGKAEGDLGISGSLELGQLVADEADAQQEAAARRARRNQPGAPGAPKRPSGGRTDDDTGEEIPVQLRLQWRLTNRDPEDTEGAMSFQLAALMQFVSTDLLTHGDFVKVLGLGGTKAIMYGPGKPSGGLLVNFNQDFLNFRGGQIDAEFVNALEGDIKVSPGDGTHYELLPRHGLRDVTALHEGVDVTRLADPTRKLFTLGAGRVAAPAILQPGDSWVGELAVRWHNHYWDQPIFGEGMPPIDPLAQKEIRSTDDTASGLLSGLEDDDDYGGLGAGDADAGEE